MFLTSLHSAQDWVEVLQTTEGSQSAVTDLSPGEASIDASDDYPGSEQVLLVLDGEVTVQIGEEKTRMQRGDVVVVPDGIRRRLRNDSQSPARTLSIYTLRPNFFSSSW